jgi:hypothetical protein
VRLLLPYDHHEYLLDFHSEIDSADVVDLAETFDLLLSLVPCLLLEPLEAKRPARFRFSNSRGIEPSNIDNREVDDHFQLHTEVDFAGSVKLTNTTKTPKKCYAR